MVIDRFGDDVPFVKVDEAHFRVMTDVFISGQFYGWVFALGTEAKITAPQNVIDGFREYISDVGGMYK